MAACSGRSGDDGAELSIRGVVSDEAGSPVAGAAVSARPPLAAQEIDTSRLSELDALGFACIDERPPPACRRQERMTKTAEDGSFVVNLDDADTLGGETAVVTAPDPLTVAVSSEPSTGQVSGPASTTQMLVGAGGGDLGPMLVWNPSLTLEATDGPDAVLRWDRAPAVDVSEFQVLVESSEGQLVWHDSSTSLEVGLRFPNLAETHGAISVVAIAADGPQRYRSARIPYRADGGAIRSASVAEVGWPTEARLPPTLVLTAIVALLLANAMVVLAAGARHRRQLVAIPVNRSRRTRR